MSKPLQVKHLHTDVLIIGGGTAGCYATLTISRNSGLNILVAERQISNEAAVLQQVSTRSTPIL